MTRALQGSWSAEHPEGSPCCGRRGRIASVSTQPHFWIAATKVGENLVCIPPLARSLFDPEEGIGLESSRINPNKMDQREVG